MIFRFTASSPCKLALGRQTSVPSMFVDNETDMWNFLVMWCMVGSHTQRSSLGASTCSNVLSMNINSTTHRSCDTTTVTVRMQNFYTADTSMQESRVCVILSESPFQEMFMRWTGTCMPLNPYKCSMMRLPSNSLEILDHLIHETPLLSAAMPYRLSPSLYLTYLCNDVPLASLSSRHDL